MSSEDSGTERESAGETTRLVLVVTCLLALVLAGVLVPSLTGGVVDSPAESLLPGDALGSNTSEPPVNPGSLEGGDLGSVDPSNLSGSGSSGFGALNPGSSTDVGGSTGVGGNSSAFQSQSSAVHFTVTSPKGTYWRTGAYDEYTGTGWAQNGRNDPLDGTIDGDGIQGPRVEYEVTLNRTAQSLPTVWRPTSVSGVSNLAVTDQRAIVSSSPVDAGTSYSGVSHRPPQDPTVLKTAGTDYPTTLEKRYGRMPEQTPERVREFTDELTAGDSTPYQKATTIEAWLERNKTYSLNASRTSETMADTFIFEMDRGYCEYFATSMVVMLRSQDIPARYTVGYSTGQQAAENTYKVRAMNAHAWVEVYFPDVGWVKFDPTPGSQRLQQERQSLQEQEPDTDYSPEEEGSPGEEFSAGNDTTSPPGGTPTPTNGTAPNGTTSPENDTDGTTNETTTNETGGTTDSGYDVSLNRTPVPGVAVEVTVTQSGAPASGVTVLFNGETVGTTDEAGTVVGRVPYADELRVTVEDGDSASLSPTGAVSTGAGDRFYRLPPPTVVPDVTLPVETNATVTVVGDRLPGANVTVVATVADTPVRNASVLVGGETVARTDDSGRATVQLPAEAGNVTIAVRRDPIAGNTTLSLPSLNLTVTPQSPLALPLTQATVRVTADGEPVSSARVRLNGEQVATTDVNGTATVTLPTSSEATVSASAYGLDQETTISGLLTNLGLLVGGLVTVVVVPLGVAYWRGYPPRAVAGLFKRVPAVLLQYGQWLLVTLATRGGTLVTRALARLRQTVSDLVAFVRGKVSGAELRAALSAWLAAKRRALLGLLGRGPATAAPAEATAETTSEDRRTIREAWAQFLSHVSLPRYRTKTPGEIARHAVHRDGLPARPVRVLRDAFREVEYGARAASDRLDSVEEAVAAIEREMEPDGDETGETATDQPAEAGDD